MSGLLLMIQAIVGFGILNVWLLRRNKETSYRGGNARTMKDEFIHYGIPQWAVPIVGSMKVGLALLILSGFINPQLTAVGATGLGLFMFVAVLMHVKVRDSLVKTLPSIIMLVFCGILALATNPNIATLASIN